MASAAVGTNAFGLDVELFTRGTGDDKPRGESLVQKHLDKLQQVRFCLGSAQGTGVDMRRAAQPAQSCGSAGPRAGTADLHRSVGGRLGCQAS